MFTQQLIEAERIHIRVSELATEIDAYYDHPCWDHPYWQRDLVLVGVLKGALHFLSDLSRALHTPHKIDFVTARSYQGTEPGPLTLDTRQLDVRDKDVLLVEDIVDTGATVQKLRRTLLDMGAKTIVTVALLRKEHQSAPPGPIQFVGFPLTNDAFVVGYGLDYNEQYRDLSYIGVLAKDSIPEE